MSNAGFALVELMIVAVVVGTLAAIGLPAYQDYVVRSQMASALAEISAGRAGFELAANQSRTPSLDPVADGYIGIADQTSYCDIVLLPAGDPDRIQCTTRGGSASMFNGRILTLQRSAQSEWVCVTVGVEAKHKPGKCS